MHAARCHQKFGVFMHVRKWHHFCLALNQDSSLYYRGKAVPPLSRCAIGRGDEDFLIEKFIIGGSMWGGVPFSGLLADVRLYDAVLNVNQVRIVAEGREASQPVFTVNESSLRNLSGSVENVQFGNVDVKSLTSTSKEDYYFYYDKKVDRIDARSLCKKIGGTQVTISADNTKEILDILLKYFSRIENAVVDSLVHIPEAPSDKIVSSCSLFRVYQDPPALQNEDGDCEASASVLCQLPMSHSLRLLGLEENITLYPIHDSLNIFEDGGNYRLIVTDTELQLENVQTGKTLYERIFSSSMQLTGRHKWSLSDNVENNNRSKSEVSLTLTACKGGQFTCSSGDCVPIEDVCNLVNDCQDATDELLCTDRTFVSDTYNKRFSPSQGTKKQTAVGLQVILEQVNHVELTENLLKVVLRLEVMWRDPRIMFKFLKRNVSVTIPEEAVNDMWLPCVQMNTASPGYRDRADFPNIKDKTVVATARTDGLDTVLGDTEGKCRSSLMCSPVVFLIGHTFL